ncbi:hypothetical protein PVAND_010018 [Polypedilum vanderplanki]|uniref:Peptidase S8 pro-domain domain-containing protein n=1 Tax=Polypedilum vanderplanki TaxID=319348 RepID=A0A9J6CF14_POLVA|nr:hypothetical protein PVAND_010018 [Polypedilum vanderplanki]
MQNTGTLSAHQNVTEKENYAKRVFDSIPTYISTRWQQQKEELLNSESDTSTTLRNNRCRRKTFAVYSTCILLLVLSCLVNVIGALDSSSSSLSNVNYYDNSTNYTRTLLDEIDDIPLLSTYLDDINDIENLTLIAGARRQPIYQNEFAVHILGGIEKANEVAKKYGFTNMGQVS